MYHPHDGQCVATHRLSQGKEELIKNGDHYRDKVQLRADLEQVLMDAFGQARGGQLCEQLRRSNPHHSLDRLRGVKRHLKRLEQLPEPLLDTMLARPGRLTVNLLLDYLKAWESNPERALSLNTGGEQPTAAPATTQPALSRYAPLTQPVGGSHALH